MTYANHEAVPLREDIQDYFREVSTFKVNHLLLPLSHEVAERTRFWRRRTGHGQYMLAYDNGKSAVRVLPGRIVPQSVHRWRTLNAGERESSILEPPAQSSRGVIADVCGGPAEGQRAGAVESEIYGGSQPASTSTPTLSPSGEPDRLVSRVAMADPRELRFDEVLACSDPCVLHYPSCGLDWLRDKYRLLGRFPSSWFDGKLPIAPCFHLDARDTVLGGRGGTAAAAGSNTDGGGNEGAGADGVRALYRKEVMLCPEEHSDEMQAQLEHGVLRVINGPGRVIEDAVHGPECLHGTASPGTRETDAEDKAGLRGAAADGGSDEIATSADALRAVEGAQPPVDCAPSDASGAAAGVDESARVDNAWILAACAREYL